MLLSSTIKPQSTTVNWWNSGPAQLSKDAHLEGRRRSGICIRDDARRQRGQAASILLETKTQANASYSTWCIYSYTEIGIDSYGCSWVTNRLVLYLGVSPMNWLIASGTASPGHVSTVAVYQRKSRNHSGPPRIMNLMNRIQHWQFVAICGLSTSIRNYSIWIWFGDFAVITQWRESQWWSTTVPTAWWQLNALANSWMLKTGTSKEHNVDGHIHRSSSSARKIKRILPCLSMIITTIMVCNG